MADKDTVRKEIELIVQEHNRRKRRSRRSWIIAGSVLLVLLVSVISLALISSYGSSSGASYDSIAGTYEIDWVYVEDSFGFPDNYYDIGNCTIDADGNIEFPYYDGEAYGEGSFGMIKGRLRQLEYAAHDYGISINTNDAQGIYLHDLYLDVVEDGIRIQEKGTRKGVGKETWYRTIDLLFTRIR